LIALKLSSTTLRKLRNKLRMANKSLKSFKLASIFRGELEDICQENTSIATK